MNSEGHLIGRTEVGWERHESPATIPLLVPLDLSSVQVEALDLIVNRFTVVALLCAGGQTGCASGSLRC